MKSIVKVSFAPGVESNKLKIYSFWNNAGIAVFICAITLFIIDVPQNINTGVKAQSAVKELDSVRGPLLDIKATAAHSYIEADVTTAKSRFEELGVTTELFIKRYEIAASYNRILSNNVADFKRAYNKWYYAEKKYIERYYRQMNSASEFGNYDYHLSSVGQENNALFLAAMRTLADAERPINDDIEKGHKAFQVLQLISALFVLYFLVTIIFFQRNSNRIHKVREKNLEVTLRSIGDAVIATDIHGCITSMNLEAERLTGWSFNEAKGCALSEVFKVIDEHSGEPVGDLVEQVKRNNIVVLAEDSVLVASNGNRYQIYENGAPILSDSGEIIGVVLVFRDITYAHELSHQVNDTVQRLQGVINSSMDAVVITNEQGMVTEWNPAAELMFGWTNEEIRKVPVYERIIPEEFREKHLQGIARVINSKQSSSTSQRVESMALHKDGHRFPVELSMSSVLTDTGWVFSAFICDLTAQKRRESIIEKNAALLHKTQSMAKLGYWELDLLNDELKWSDQIFRIFGLDDRTSKPSYELFINAVHPDDRERIDTAYSESVKNKTPYDIVHRIVTPEGVKVVREQCETTYDDNDNPVRSLGLVQDITERIHSMDELRLATATFNTHAGILITEKDGTIVRVNPAIEEMTGYTSTELIGQTPRIFRSGKQSDTFYEAMWNSLSEKGMWQGELWNKRKDGSSYAEWLTITAVKDSSGEVTHYVATSQDITERKQAELQIEHLAYHDDLTSLANRRLLRDRLQQSLAVCRRHGGYGAVLLLDLDRFKDLNDSLGHSAGDEILRQVASRLKKVVREEDTVARLGGDEFVVVLSSVSDDILKVGLKVQAIAEKIRLRLSEPYRYKNEQCYSNASIGISLFPEASEDIDDILKHADTALYRAKALGRNTICFYETSMQSEVDERLVIADGLRNALINNEFTLHYQPQINARNKLTGAEALIRWEHPGLGMIPPDKFISVAEDTGLILEIGQWVLQTAASQMAEWHTNNVCQQQCLMRLAINVSPRQFRQRDFVSQVLTIFEKAGVSLDCIELEVTESLLMDDLEDVIDKMQTLRSHGISISIDDFGTGYSSLAYLNQLPLDKLKIDQSFIRDISSNNNHAVVVETIIAMGHHLGLSVIAEGVETKEQLDFLTEKGCKAFQGYYFSRPTTAEEFTKYIEDSRAD